MPRPSYAHASALIANISRLKLRARPDALRKLQSLVHLRQQLAARRSPVEAA